jgi:putative restriction endonuclease
MGLSPISSVILLLSAMKFYIGITDEGWFRSLSSRNAFEGNFWRPGGTPFKVLEPGDFFLFKLKSPKNAIVGGGQFVHYSRAFSSFAWDAFGLDNGVESNLEFLERLLTLGSKDRSSGDPEIGCIMLDHLFFFSPENWIEAPSDWAKNIVSGKSYDLENPEGRRIWKEVRDRLEGVPHNIQTSLVMEHPVGFREEVGMRRLGQGAFRTIVATAYDRRCALTGERTLPVLEAAHIRPVTKNGSHYVRNGILMRSDLHKLFDAGYLTITPDYTIKISSAIRDRYQNGKLYYALDNSVLAVLPEDPAFHPSKDELLWHHEHVFLPGR